MLKTEVTYGETVSLGNYEFFRLDRSVIVTAETSEELNRKAEKALGRLQEWIWKMAEKRLKMKTEG